MILCFYDSTNRELCLIWTGWTWTGQFSFLTLYLLEIFLGAGLWGTVEKSHGRKAELSMNGRCHGTERYGEAKWAVCRGRNCWECVAWGAVVRREGTMGAGLEKKWELVFWRRSSETWFNMRNSSTGSCNYVCKCAICQWMDSTAEKCSFFAHVPAYTNHVEVRGKKWDFLV